MFDSAVFRTRTFHISALAATLALAALNGCQYEHPAAPTLRIEAYGTENTTCAEWTDGCRVCQRVGGGAAPACSLPGIACVRGPITCTATEP